jgi:hypothetical protein
MLGGDTAKRDAILHEGFLRHARFRWAKVAAVVASVAILIYAFDDPQPHPGGGTAYGFTLGTIGALLILWLTALGVRKRVASRERWSLKAWTSAHVYLGLALLVIGTLHTGFHFGKNVHTLAYVLMLLVIASGLVGIGFYTALPRALSDNRGELTERQMVAALAALDRQLLDAAQSLDDLTAAMVHAALSEDPFDARLLRRLTGQYPRDATEHALMAFRSPGAKGNDRAEALIERRRSMLKRMRRHMQLRAMLEVWLYVHVPATFALIAALIAHILAETMYW